MSNRFFNFVSRFVAGTSVRSGAVNTQFDNVAAAAALIQAELDAFSPTGVTSPPFTLASAATTLISTATSFNVIMTGTATVTAFDAMAAGILRYVTAAGAFTLTHNATSLIIPGGLNILAAVNDAFVLKSLGSGNWQVIMYQRASGLQTAVNGDLYASDLIADYVVSGLLSPTSADLNSTMTAGSAYAAGVRVTLAATAKLYTASKDTYVDLSNTGVLTYVEVANGAGAPAVTASSIRLQKVVTNGTAVTSVTQLASTNMTAAKMLATPTAAKTAAYTATLNDDFINCDATGGAFAVTLPPVATAAGRTFGIRKSDASANAVTLADTIDGTAGRALLIPYATYFVRSNGVTYSIIGAWRAGPGYFAALTVTGQSNLAAGSVGAPTICAIGDGNTGVYFPAAGVIGQVTAGVERARIASDGSFSSVIPGGSTLLPEFKCRAWVNFNGVSTISIRGSGNVASVTDNAVGSYTVNLTTAMPDVNFAAMLSCEGVGSGGNTASVKNTGITTSSVPINTFDSGTAGTDLQSVFLAIFR